MPTPLPMISITATSPNGQSYKSINSVIWKDIPGLAILTGRNGSGKTHLLELLSYHFTGALPHNSSGGKLPLDITVLGEKIPEDQVGFVPVTGRFSGSSSASVGQIPDLRQSILRTSDRIRDYANDPIQISKAKYYKRILAGKRYDKLTIDEINEIFPDDYSALLNDVDVVSHLATIFVAYRLKYLESIESGHEGFDSKGIEIGPAPWDIANDSLKTAGFPYEIISPKGTRITDQYNLLFRDKVSNNIINPDSLSSGEKVILQIMMWLFGASKEGIFPRLLLLDEPDAHLHPSMTVQFLSVLSEILVNKYGVRVIMTTHSPSTVALAPDEAIFQMERGNPLIEKVSDKFEVISMLTAGLITISPATKFCFVEDEDDVEFYDAARDILTDYGPSKDPFALAPSPTLAFIAASVGAGASKVSGGSSIVAKWVEKLDAPPLTRTFLGLIDRDAGTKSTTRVKVIGRYSFENYLLDPINVFALLLEDNAAPLIAGLSVTPGDEHLLRSQTSIALQAASDAISAAIQSCNPHLSPASSIDVSYTTGQLVQVPGWVRDFRGHDLLPAAQAAWGGPKRINPPRLIKAFKRARLVPKDLASALSDLQKV